MEEHFVWMTTRQIEPGTLSGFERAWRPDTHPEGMLRAYAYWSADERSPGPPDACRPGYLPAVWWHPAIGDCGALMIAAGGGDGEVSGDGGALAAGGPDL